MNQSLLAEIQRFASDKSLYRRDEHPDTIIQMVNLSLKLLEELPVLRDSIFDYYSIILDAQITCFIKQEKTAQINELDEKVIEIIRDGLEKLIFGHPWAPVYVSQWALSRLIKPSVDYAKILNLDFKGSCNLWLGCIATRMLLDLCGYCLNSFDDKDLKRFIFELENIFVDNRPNFDWCVAHLSSLFPIKFISNILRMPSMFKATYITSTVTVLEYLSNTGDQKLKILLREILDEALNDDSNDFKTKDYIPNLLQLASKSEIYAQSILNVCLDNVEKDYNDFKEKLKKQFIMKSKEFNAERLNEMLPDLFLRCKQNGIRLLLKLIEKNENSLWITELVELIIIEIESAIYSDDRNCAFITDVGKEKNWSLLWKACASPKDFLQQTSVRFILLASHQKSCILYSKTIEKLISENTYTQPHILKALIKLVDDNIAVSDGVEVQNAISLVIQQLSIGINNSKQQNKSYFTIKNLVDLISFEKNNQNVLPRRNLITAALQTSFLMIIQIWEDLLRKVVTISNRKTETSNGDKNARFEKDNLDPLEIADIENESVYGLEDQIHMLTSLINNLNIVALTISNTVHCEKITAKYFFWSLMEKDSFKRSIIMERCFNLLSKQCSSKKGIKTMAIRDLLEGALFLYPKMFLPKSVTQMRNENQDSYVKDESLLKLNQRQRSSFNFSKSSILLHSGTVGSKMSNNWLNLQTYDVDNEIKNFLIEAIVSCCQEDSDETEQDKSKMLEGLCNVSHLLVELISSDVMYNGLHWPIEDDFTKITMERDLHVRRIFKNRPILWSILGLLAQYKIPLWCNCSVFLRALCGSIMHHWRAKAENRNENNEELMFFTVKFLELLALAKLLPSPLNNLHIVVIYFEPSEISYVLKECVWNYFVAKSMSSFDPTNQEVPSEQFINPLRNTMQKKLSILGNIYYQMKFK